MALVFLLAVSVLSLRAEVLDKIAVIVDHTVVTEMQLDEELRVTAFLNHEPVKQDATARQAAAKRLIEQELVRQEASATQYLPPSSERVDQLYTETEKEYGGAKPMSEALAKYGLTQVILKDHLRRQLMIPILAYRLQEKALGGLRPSTIRRLRSIFGEIAEGKKPAIRESLVLRPGTRLVRQWQGKLHEVVTFEGSFMYDGQKYRSLSEIARAITGARWSGPVFFGLKKRKTKEAA